MKIRPVYEYTCEYCGMGFKNSNDCNKHEDECELWQHRKSCPECDGYGKRQTDYRGLEPGKWTPASEIFWTKCWKCDGKGWINKISFEL